MEIKDKREVYWAIEKSIDGQAHWWMGLTGAEWSTNVHNCMKYITALEALNDIEDFNLSGCFVTEHMDMDMPKDFKASVLQKPEPVSNPDELRSADTGKHELEKGDEYVEFWKELFDDLYMTDHHIAEVAIAFARGMMAGKQEALQSNTQQKEQPDTELHGKGAFEILRNNMSDNLWTLVCTYPVGLGSDKMLKDWIIDAMEEYANQFKQ